MILVREIFVSERVLDADFACALGVCHGDCCRVGGRGAPLTDGEADALEALAPERADLTPWAAAARKAGRGPVERHRSAAYTALLLDGEVRGVCHFATFDGPTLRCGLESRGPQDPGAPEHPASAAGRAAATGLPFPKPLSCHLFPIRVERFLGRDALTLEPRPECAAGYASGTPLVGFLKAPLVRAYGEPFYLELSAAATRRRTAGCGKVAPVP